MVRPERTWYTYIVRCADSSLYTGITTNLSERITKHNAGVGAKYTNSRRPVKLVKYWKFSSRSEAAKEESRIKSLSKVNKEKLLPWYQPTKWLRENNALLRHYVGINPDELNVDTFDYYQPYFQDTGIRTRIARDYSWAVPSEEALQEITKFSPVVEMGAGTGYWAYLLQNLGCDIVAYDEHPPNLAGEGLINAWHSNGVYAQVLQAKPSVLKRHPDRTLFLCWPPQFGSMARECLTHWKGKYLIYVGELHGCCAEEQFFDTLETMFECIKIVNIPCWMGLHDCLYVFRRLTNVK